MTNELKSYGDGAMIYEFVAGGPKNYGYRVQDSNGQHVSETVKVRGFAITHENKKTVNFDSLKDMVIAFCTENEVIVKTIVENRILRNTNRSVVSKICSKDYRVVYSKRSVYPNYCTLPFGYLLVPFTVWCFFILYRK